MLSSRMSLVAGAILLGATAGRLYQERTPPLRPVDPLRALLPRIAPREPAEAVKTFRTLHGFHMELLASEPLVSSPVALEYDENGRAWVVEMRDYPYTDRTTDRPFVERTTDRPLGRIRVLEDTDGDGRFDRSTVFAEGLSWPTGIAFWKGGVFVAATPDLWYLKDTDGDGKADVRHKVLTGFRKFNVQAVVNNLRWGLDHRIYGAGATNGGLITRPDRPSEKPVRMAAHDFRLDPVTESFELIPGGARFGNTFDDWGNRFICNIRNPVRHAVLPGAYLARNPYLPVRSALHDAAQAGDTLPVYRASPPEPWRVLNAQRLAGDSSRPWPRSETTAVGYFTSACGITVYRGSAYPARFHGNVFLAEVAGNLIHRQTLRPDGVTFVAERADPDTEFVASTDNWFRPVNFVNAPDGTLHVLDMYRETIEHPWSIPDDIKAHLDLESGRERGRIYRLAPPSFHRPMPPRLGRASIEELVACLARPDSWWRETAHRLLYERQDRRAVAPLRRLVREGPPIARLHALWSLQGLAALDAEDLLRAVDDPEARLREHAIRLAEPHLMRSSPLLQAVLRRADDPEVRVRFQAALSLGAVEDQRILPALARIARRDGSDPWLRTAILSAVRSSAGELLIQLLDGPAVPDAMLRELAQVAAAARPTAVSRLLARADKATSAQKRDIVVGMADGVQRSGRRLAALVGPTDSSAGRLLAELIRDAAQVARGDGPLEGRLQAIRLLGCTDLPAVRSVLEDLLQARQPLPVQAASVRTLVSYRGAEVPAMLLRGYSAHTPAVRREVIEALLGRAEWLAPLLEAIEQKRVPSGDIPLARRAALVKHANAAVRHRATALFGSEPAGPRKQVVERYRSALALTGNRLRGQRIFQRECQSCHRLHGQGHEVGPDLATVRHRSPAEVLLHILDPNREVSPGYIEYIVILVDGRQARGIITSETPGGITLARADGVRETLRREDIEEIRSTGQSLMPEGLEKGIDLPAMADLLAYILGGP